MKNLKIATLAILTALTLAACAPLEDTPQAAAVNPLINADATISVLDEIGAVPCGVWEKVSMVDERGTETGYAAVINDEDNFYFYVQIPEDWQMLGFAAFTGQVDEIPAEDGMVDYDAFQIVEELEEPTQTQLITLSRRNIENCSAFVIAIEVQFATEDTDQEAMSKVIMLDGVDVHNVKAFKYCAQEC